MTPINRAQRRAARGQEPRRLAPVPALAGSVLRQLELPVLAGEITAAEATELKALKALVDRLDADILHLRQLRISVDRDRGSFMRDALRRRGLNPDEGFQFNDDNGQIIKTHELAGAEVQYIEIPAPDPEETPAEPEVD